MITVICLSHNRIRFLKDYLNSFEKYSLPGTRLLIGLQGCTDGSVQYMQRREFQRLVSVFVYDENIGLNRYDDLVKMLPDDAVFADSDDDCEFTRSGWEDILEKVAVGFIGLPFKDMEVLPFKQEKLSIGGYTVAQSPVSGGLAVTTKKIWTDVGGFGIGRSRFDPEDARYQAKCHTKGYPTGMIEGIEPFYEHHASWDWKIRYGCSDQRLGDLHEALKAGFIDEATYRLSCQEYLQIIDGMYD